MSVETCVPQLLDKNISAAVASTNHYKYDDEINIMGNDTSSNNKNMRSKSRSYLMAAKGPLEKVNTKVNQIDHFVHFVQLT